MVTTFNPEGRLEQLEFAMRAVDKGQLSLAFILETSSTSKKEVILIFGMHEEDNNELMEYSVCLL